MYPIILTYQMSLDKNTGRKLLSLKQKLEQGHLLYDTPVTEGPR